MPASFLIVAAAPVLIWYWLHTLRELIHHSFVSLFLAMHHFLLIYTLALAFYHFCHRLRQCAFNEKSLYWFTLSELLAHTDFLCHFKTVARKHTMVTFSRILIWVINYNMSWGLACFPRSLPSQHAEAMALCSISLCLWYSLDFCRSWNESNVIQIKLITGLILSQDGNYLFYSLL